MKLKFFIPLLCLIILPFSVTQAGEQLDEKGLILGPKIKRVEVVWSNSSSAMIYLHGKRFGKTKGKIKLANYEDNLRISSWRKDLVTAYLPSRVAAATYEVKLVTGSLRLDMTDTTDVTIGNVQVSNRDTI